MMAGPPRDPSRPHSRAHRGSTRSPGGLVQLPARNTLPTPSLPEQIVFGPLEADLWEHLWTTGVSTMWSESDLPAVIAYVRLEARMLADGLPVNEQTELRHLRDSLLLTPAARRRAGIEAPQ